MSIRVLVAPGRPAWTDDVARELGAVVVDPIPTAVEAGLRLWGRRSTRDLLRADAVRRKLAGRLAHLGPADEVIAPSLGALEVFERAGRARRTLLLDLPDLAGLAADLDAAAGRWPDCGFLANHRPSPEDVARQRQERLLADRVYARSRFAAAGHPDARRFPSRPLVVRKASGDPVAGATGGRPLVVRLAGLATARNGSAEALAALDVLRRDADVRLSVRLGDGAWPGALRDHPAVVGPDVPCDVLWAPAWVETGDAEVAAAARAGIPIVATSRAAGWEVVHLVRRGDVHGLVDWTRRLVGRDARILASCPTRTSSSPRPTSAPAPTPASSSCP